MPVNTRSIKTIILVGTRSSRSTVPAKKKRNWILNLPLYSIAWVIATCCHVLLYSRLWNRLIHHNVGWGGSKTFPSKRFFSNENNKKYETEFSLRISPTWTKVTWVSGETDTHRTTSFNWMNFSLIEDFFLMFKKSLKFTSGLNLSLCFWICTKTQNCGKG